MKKAKSPKNVSNQPRVNDRYTRLAMSSLNHCNRSIEQLRAISVLIATVLRKPAVTEDERRAEHTVMSLLMETVEGYERSAEAYRELVTAVATDACDLPDMQLSADEALRLMEAEVESPARPKKRAARQESAITH